MTVRYAVVGYGLAGSVFHAPLIDTTPGAELTAVVARSAEAREAVTARYPGAVVVDDVTALPDLGVDAAVVATPNPTHGPIAAQLIALGVGAVVDKPLATSVAEAEALISTAAASGVLLTCYQNRRWDGDFLTVQALVDDGALGTVHRFESRFERWRPQIKASWKERAEPGSGVLFDLGPHVIDQALQLLGPAQVVDGWSRTLRRDAVVPDDAFVEMRHDNGAVSQLSVSLVAAAPGPRFRVLGDAGAFVKDGLDPQEDELRTGAVPGPGWGVEPEDAWGTLWGDDGGRPVATLPGDYPSFYRLLTEHIAGDGPLPVDPRDSLQALRIIETVSA